MILSSGTNIRRDWMARFSFGVRYRFVSGEGVPETEAAIAVIPVAWPVQDLESELDTIDRLASLGWGGRSAETRRCCMWRILAAMERGRVFCSGSSVARPSGS